MEPEAKPQHYSGTIVEKVEQSMAGPPTLKGERSFCGAVGRGAKMISGTSGEKTDEKVGGKIGKLT
jgi:hypothetical protein